MRRRGRKKRNGKYNGEEKKRDKMLEKEEWKQPHKCYMCIV